MIGRQLSIRHRFIDRRIPCSSHGPRFLAAATGLSKLAAGFL